LRQRLRLIFVILAAMVMINVLNYVVPAMG